MKPLWIVLPLLIVAGACARLPEIRPADGGAPGRAALARSIYPGGDWQFLHAIEATGPGGRTQTMLGLIQLTPEHNGIHCVMMTLEGLVIFEADYDGRELHTSRAVAPFDKPGFAEGIMADLQLIFLAPAQPPSASGRTPEGARVERYELANGRTQDLMLRPDGGWEIRRFDSHHRPDRTVRCDPAAGRSAQGFPNRLALEAPGLTGYHLTMSLIEAVPLGNDP